MRPATHLPLLALLLVAGTGQGLTADLDPPAVVPTDGTPFQVPVHLTDLPDEPVELKAWLGGETWQASRTHNGTAWQRSDHYALTVQGPGTWQGRLLLRANPEATHHGRLVDASTAVLGVRARTGDGWTSARETVVPVPDPSRVLVDLSPGDRVHLPERPAPALWVHAGQEPSITTVAVAPDLEGPVCISGTCQPATGVHLLAVGRHSAVLTNTGETPADLTGAVLQLPEGRCPTPKRLDPGARVLVTTQPVPQATGLDPRACTPTGPGSAFVALHHLGIVLDEHPPPSTGWHVRGLDPQHRWLPWPVPQGVLPEAPRVLEVQGQGFGFGTREAGFSTVLETIASAENELLVATYLFTHEAVASALARAVDRGVDVQVWLEPEPIGGMPGHQRDLVDRLEVAGVEVRWITGPTDRGLQHAKLVVADGCRALLLTENLTHSGLPTGQQGNLGLGIALTNGTIARALAASFEPRAEDTPSPRPCRAPAWPAFHGQVAILEAPMHTADPTFVTELVTTAKGPLTGLALTASPRWHDQANPWLAALVEASTRHPVDVLLNGVATGDRPSRANHPALAYLRAHPQAGELTAWTSTPGEGRVHAKAILAPTWGLVGSSNWGPGGALWNKELNVVIFDPRIAGELSAAAQPEAPGQWPLVVPGASVGAWLSLAVAGGVLVRRWHGQRSLLRALQARGLAAQRVQDAELGACRVRGGQRGQ